ncbi:MAG: hypothetical protein AAFO02_00565 [Bacteroidota bacterium]
MADTSVAKASTSKTPIDPANKFLPAAVAEHYEVVNWQGGHTQVFGKFGTVDLQQMTLTRAQRLVNTKFSKLVKKSK